MSRPAPSFLLVLLRRLPFLLAVALTVSAWAGEIRAIDAEGREQEGRYSIDARFAVSLDPVHENALLAGVPLTFAVEFTLTHPRWYWAYRRLADWFDATSRLEYRLSYHALTRQYRVGVGSLHLSFDTLSEALRALGVVRDWQVFERGSLTRSAAIAGELSMRLDLAKLPKPLQLSLLGDSEWRLQSDPVRVNFGEAR
ncbi:DUF4390 domain-containing protein [Chitinimonas lacunae]|uniref:DUF4390 domain-containing protein n=1 Tax=Chitinimonas lacunae TaxID=1963018 RepID=A0ABV8MPC0_9NEIS